MATAETAAKLQERLLAATENRVFRPYKCIAYTTVQLRQLIGHTRRSVILSSPKDLYLPSNGVGLERHYRKGKITSTDEGWQILLVFLLLSEAVRGGCGTDRRQNAGDCVIPALQRRLGHINHVCWLEHEGRTKN